MCSLMQTLYASSRWKSTYNHFISPVKTTSNKMCRWGSANGGKIRIIKSFFNKCCNYQKVFAPKLCSGPYNNVTISMRNYNHVHIYCMSMASIGEMNLNDADLMNPAKTILNKQWDHFCPYTYSLSDRENNREGIVSIAAIVRNQL